MSNSRKNVLSTLLAAAVLLGAGAAYASSPAKLDALNNAPLSAAQAIEKATAKVAGTATDVDFKHTYGKDYYEVEVIANGQKHELDIDAANGNVLGEKNKATRKTVPATKISLTQAMDAAVAKTGGKVEEAELDHKKGQAVYEVKTVANGQKFKTVINADSGEVMESYAKQIRNTNANTNTNTQ